MNLTVFGPTGGTGEQIVTQALAAGHAVTAVARRPEAVQHGRGGQSRLHPVGGDVFEPATLIEVVTGADAVLSALGTRDLKQPTTVYSVGTSAILTAMAQAGVRRFVGISAAPAAPDDHKNLFERRLLHPLLGHFFGGAYEDMRRMEQLLVDSDRDWTIFRPPRLTSRSASGRYRTAVDSRLSKALTISRADLAAAMLAAIEEPTVVRHAVSIAE